MLRKRQRLTSLEVQKVLSKGRSVRSERIQAKYISGKGLKISIIVPKSVARLAVRRNSIRRAAYRALKGVLPSLPAGNTVFLIRSLPPTLTSEAFTEELSYVVKKL